MEIKMQVSRTLEDAIEKGNLSAVYSTFYTIAHEDPNFSTGKFDETLNYVKGKHIPGLMQPYDGKPRKGAESWNEEYWAEVASDLVDNFCEERIAHLRQVGRKVYPVTAKKAAQGQNPSVRANNGGVVYRGRAEWSHGSGGRHSSSEGRKPELGVWGRLEGFGKKIFGRKPEEQNIRQNKK